MADEPNETPFFAIGGAISCDQDASLGEVVISLLGQGTVALKVAPGSILETHISGFTIPAKGMGVRVSYGADVRREVGVPSEVDRPKEGFSRGETLKWWEEASRNLPPSDPPFGGRVQLGPDGLTEESDAPTRYAYDAACKALWHHRERADKAEATLQRVTGEAAALRQSLRAFFPPLLLEDRTVLSPIEIKALERLESPGVGSAWVEEHEQLKARVAELEFAAQDVGPLRKENAALKKQLAEEADRRQAAEGILRSCVFEGLTSGGDLIPKRKLEAGPEARLGVPGAQPAGRSDAPAVGSCSTRARAG
jgi:hypothetical protein